MPADGQRALALFDFDGTITTNDTYMPFMRLATPSAGCAIASIGADTPSRGAEVPSSGGLTRFEGRLI